MAVIDIARVCCVLYDWEGIWRGYDMVRYWAYDITFALERASEHATRCEMGISRACQPIYHYSERPV